MGYELTYEPIELWDVYDKERNKTGKLHERGRPLATGDYHIIVHSWKRNVNAEWLINKRTSRYANDELDGKWESTGGCVVAGEDSLTAALRETKEELGIDLNPKNGDLFSSTARERNGHTWFEDVWVFKCDVQIESLVFDEREVCGAKWVSVDKIREMIAVGDFLGEKYYPYFEDMAKCYEGQTGGG